MCRSDWSGSSATAPADEPRDAATAARQFYRDVLQGRQVWPTDRPRNPRSAWFLVGATLVEVTPHLRRAGSPIVLEVDDPEALAARCWDAGFTVSVRQDAPGGGRVSVLDPFGRQVELAPREVTMTTMPPRLVAGDEWR